MKKIIDLENWPRKKHFLFFNQFDDPTYDITAKVDCTKAYRHSKETGGSFFLYYLHCSMKAVNAVEEFRMRLEDDQIVCYDIIHAGPTIARDNGTFGFSHLPFHEDFEAFEKSAKQIIEKVKNDNSLEPSFNREDVIHYSSVPWIDFTAVTHPKFSFNEKESIPKITFGKLTDVNGTKKMAVSIKANHAFIDGFHMSKYFGKFQEFLNN